MDYRAASVEVLNDMRATYRECVRDGRSAEQTRELREAEYVLPMLTGWTPEKRTAALPNFNAERARLLAQPAPTGAQHQ